MSEDQVGEPQLASGESPSDEMRRISRKSFLWAGASLLGTYGAYRWLNSRSDKGQGGKPWPFRKAFEFDESVARSFGQGEARRFSEKDVSADAKVNGGYALAEVKLPEWRLRIELPGQSRVMTIEEIRALPASEMIAELNCIEGWTRIIRWRGVRMMDLLAGLNESRSKELNIPIIDPAKLPAYMGLETPKRGYYVGLDRESALHPQSLLAYEIDGQPLSDDHGAPLRHVLPIKYGYKQLKHVGLIRFTDERPADFWAEQGYDWYGGF